MSADIPKQATRKIVAWLNEQYPSLAVVMYDIGARYGIHYLYTELLNLRNFSVIGFEPDQQEVAKLTDDRMSGIKKTWRCCKSVALFLGMLIRLEFTAHHQQIKNTSQKTSNNADEQMSVIIRT